MAKSAAASTTIIARPNKPIVSVDAFTVPPRWRLLQQDPGAADLLAAERAEEVRHQPVHQLEVRRQRRRVLLRVVQDLFPIALRVQRRAGAAVDEDELGPQDEALALHVGADRTHG